MAESIASQLKRIERNLNRVADACETDIMATLFTQAALIASEMKSICAVDPSSPTPGAARDSIRVEEGIDKRGHKLVRILAGGKLTRKAGFAYVYDFVRALEFGTVNMPAQSFFWSVWRARRKAVHAAVKMAVKRAVAKVWK